MYDQDTSVSAKSLSIDWNSRQRFVLDFCSSLCEFVCGDGYRSLYQNLVIPKPAQRTFVGQEFFQELHCEIFYLTKLKQLITAACYELTRIFELVSLAVHRMTNHPDFVGIIPILLENPESRRNFGRD